MKRCLLSIFLILFLSCGEEKNPFRPGSSLTGMITFVFEENLNGVSSPSDSTQKAAKSARPALINSLEIRVLKSDNSLLVSKTDTPKNNRFEGAIEVQALNDLKVLCIGKNNTVIERFGIDDDVDVKPGETTEAVITGWLTPYTPYMNDISTEPSSDGSFTVSWNRHSTATTSVLQEADNTQFTGAKTVYTGPDGSKQITGKASGTYYYRVSVANDYGVMSGWSAPVSVKVAYAYTLSGTVTGADGVTVTLSGDKSEIQTVNNGGQYTFSAEQGGSYTVTPTKTGYTFNPQSKSFSTVTTNQIQDFAAIQKYTLTMAVSPTGGGTTNPAVGTHTYEEGTVVSVTATPATGYRFVSWMGNVADANSATTTVTISSDQTVTANFEKISFSGITLASIPGGTFQMGSDSGYSDEKPVHTVTVSGFDMSIYEITQEQYQSVMGTNPSSSYGVGDTYPVYYVSWWDAIKFCNALSANKGLDKCYNESTGACDFTKNGYRLPTEAEWEYACRAGTTTAYYTGDSEIDLARAGWYWANWGQANNKAHVVGEKEPNSFGLYDMHGNVWEWCHDWYGSYSSGSVVNPTGAQTGASRVMRGGSWLDYDYNCRSSSRYFPGNWFSLIGFRVVRRVSSQNF